MTIPDTMLRNGTLADLRELLEAQDAVKYDVVASASRLQYVSGLLRIDDPDLARLDESGVTEGFALLQPTEIFESGVAEKLGIPRQYLRKLREPAGGGGMAKVAVPVSAMPLGTSRTDTHLLLDVNVNGWLQQQPARKFLVRGFADADGGGIARAFLSDSYGMIDHVDTLAAVLDAIRSSDVHVETMRCELTEKTMRVQLVAPELKALAPELLKGYRSPWGGGIERVREVAAGEGAAYEPGTEPVLFAGIEISNSETGGGAFSIVPRLVIQICRNGMKINRDVVRAVHHGAKLDEGVVKWSLTTQRTALDLVKARTVDAVKTFLDVEYMKRVVAEIETKAVQPLDDAQGTIEHVAKVHAYSDDERRSIFDCFIASGQMTAGGVMQAVTAAAQRVASPDRASELEDDALDVLNTAARFAVVGR